MGYQLRALRVSVTRTYSCEGIGVFIVVISYIHHKFRYTAEQSVTLAVVACERGIRICFASVEVGVAELLARLKGQAEGKNPVLPASASSY
jgi:hypothetical protein